jgi:hypothetical protein
MVHDLVQPLSPLQGSAATIPPLDFEPPFILFYSHRPYNSQPEDFNFITTASLPEDFEHDSHLDDFFEECIPIMTMTCECQENESSPFDDARSMLPRQTMQIRSWGRWRCRFCRQTDEIGKSVIPSVILAIADNLLIIISCCVGLRASSYRTTIDSKHDDTCDRHRHDLPSSLINQHIESDQRCPILHVGSHELGEIEQTQRGICARGSAHYPVFGGATTAAATTQ